MTVALWLEDKDLNPDNAPQFLRTLVDCLDQGITLGGYTARGVGLARLSGDIVYRCYDLEDIDDHADWLDEHRTWREHPASLPESLDSLPSVEASQGDPRDLRVTFRLKIPRGQDLLIGDGQGLDYEIEPQRIVDASGAQYWRLPGASLRGMFRSWVTRLAAREGKRVADHAQRQWDLWHDKGDPERGAFNGRNLGWCYITEAERNAGVRPTCPVTDLFGSLFKVGRLHISDAFAQCSSNDPNAKLEEEQVRMHVAVDRITGGAAEGMLFSNTVLTAYPSGESPIFDVTMRIRDATYDDARWLAATLRALHLGILRVGSSKSSGRLALAEPPIAIGSQGVSQPFTDLAI